MVNLPIERNEFDWSDVESNLGFLVNDNYKEFYETLGSIELDEFFYIVNAVGDDGLVSHVEITVDAYRQLAEFIDQPIDLPNVWLPVGYTIDGVYVFCNQTSVMLTDGGFNNAEIYNQSLLDFLAAITSNKITNSEHLVSDIADIDHKVLILSKS